MEKKGQIHLGQSNGDVNGDGVISPLDALLIINRINNPLPQPAEVVEVEAAVDRLPGDEPDGRWIAGEGESTSEIDYASRVDSIFDAYDDLVRVNKRKSTV